MSHRILEKRDPAPRSRVSGINNTVSAHFLRRLPCELDRELPRELEREPPLDRRAAELPRDDRDVADDRLGAELRERLAPDEPELRKPELRDLLAPDGLELWDLLAPDEPELRDRLDPSPLERLERLFPDGDCRLRPEPREEPELAPGICIGPRDPEADEPLRDEPPRDERPRDEPADGIRGCGWYCSDELEPDRDRERLPPCDGCSGV